MMHFIKHPNLPEGRVSSVLVGAEYTGIINALESRGVEVLKLPPNHIIDAAVSSHADMSAYYCGSGELIISKDISLQCSNIFPESMNIITACRHQFTKYPHDISLNACEIGNFIVCNEDYTDSEICSHALRRNKSIIDIKQGYSRCSICILDENHIITADRMIARKLKNYNIDSLLISPGFFKLPGYEYGFIGGSSFKLSRDVIAFTGTLTGHPDEVKILDYIDILGISTVFLTSEQCFDIGSAIPLTEERL